MGFTLRIHLVKTNMTSIIEAWHDQFSDLPPLLNIRLLSYEWFWCDRKGKKGSGVALFFNDVLLPKYVLVNGFLAHELLSRDLITGQNQYKR